MSWLGQRSVDGGIDEIVVGGRATGIWLCGKRVTGPDPAAALARIVDEGATRAASTILCLCQPHEIDERYPGYVEWLEANEGDEALWRPIPDLGTPTIDEAERLAAEIVERLDRDEPVIVHCGAGMGRAPTVAICALLAKGERLDDLLTAVAYSRPLAGPESGSQMELVEAFAARVGR